MATHALWKDREKLGSLAEQKGENWFKQLAPKFEELPEGTLVVINVETGEFLSGENQHDLLSTFKKHFGDATGWVCEVHRRQE